MALGICEILLLKIILEDLKIDWKKPMSLYCDNKLEIKIAHNSVQRDRTKHVEVDTHFIRRNWIMGQCLHHLNHLEINLHMPT